MGSGCSGDPRRSGQGKGLATHPNKKLVASFEIKAAHKFLARCGVVPKYSEHSAGHHGHAVLVDAARGETSVRGFDDNPYTLGLQNLVHNVCNLGS